MKTIHGINLNVCVRENTNDKITTESVFGGEYEFGGVKHDNGDAFIDIGGHIGTWSMVMASKYPKSKVYCYEGIPENAIMCDQNAKINHLGNMHVFNRLVGESNKGLGTIHYTASTTNFGVQHRFVGNTQGQGMQGNAIEIPNISLDAIFEENDIKHCRVLKIDCEGCEVGAIAGFNQLNMEKIDYIVGEFHPTRGGVTFPMFLRMLEPTFENIGNYSEGGLVMMTLRRKGIV